ncbi:RnfABCDGE type electron transport complex subunit G [Limisalsivibrio acetivorans]|uniref:RnfABCDGE type electron transport complex subunit G n=1 Tax=Limisalsivibrio acetivorans TaxID=1304888 RepID=UPI0003B74DB2|nr:RnfABCDGE type electron transport complex subunit G [Limisalsivibrio acetivorans]
MNQGSFKMVIVLTVIAGISSLILAFVYSMTKDKIAEEYRKDFLKGLQVVLPEFENEPDVEAVEYEGKKLYPAKQDGEIVAWAVRSVSHKGYSGDIAVLIGVNLEGEVTGIEILKHAETPGLGNKIEFPEWRASFKGLTANDNIAVKKDGGNIDEFSGATISPRAVCEAVSKGLSFMEKALPELSK